jgi:opacity protein-like surface antigen
MKSSVIIAILVALLAASLLAVPATEAFMTVESALINRFGNAGYGKFDQAYAGGWIPNGVEGLPTLVHHLD